MASRGLGLIALLPLGFAVAAAQAQAPAESAQQLVKDVVYNELADHQHHKYFEYLDSKRAGAQTVVKAELETCTGRVDRMLAEDGKPLSSEKREEESLRLETLLHDARQQQRLLREYQGDEDRIGRIMRLMPEGFLYRYDGVDGDAIRLKYQPNPAFKPPTYEARIFHGMTGTVWIDARQKRLRRLDGQLVSNVDFGYGLLGRLEKGGTFNMERFEALPGSWKTKVLAIHMSGYVVLLKSISMDQEEVRSDFREIPTDVTLPQAEAMLNARAIMDVQDAHFDAKAAGGNATKVAMALTLK